MKTSYYNIYIEEEKCVVCYNTIFDAFLLVSKADFGKLQNDLEGLQKESLSVYEAMIKHGFIIDDEVDEQEMLAQEYEKEIYASSKYELTLLPTLDCNLRCWYCYEKHKVGSHFQEKVPESIVAHVKRVFQEREYLDSLSVTMFGGEPLMYFKEELYPLLLRLKETLEKMQKQVTFFFVTNAVCITDELIPLFANLNAGFQISIDGNKERHDKVKFIPGTREGTFDQVLATVRKLTSQIENTYITLRINYDDDTLPRLAELIPEIKDIDRRKIGIHLERVWQTSQNAVNYNNRLLQRVINEFTNQGFKVTYINLHRRTLSCKSSSYNQVIISYDGNAYKCTGRDFTESFSDGLLQEDGTIVWKQEQLDKRMGICTFKNEHCLKCKFLPQCWGPCNQKLLESKLDILSLCPLNTMEMELDDYIRYRLKNHYMQDQLWKLLK